MDSLHIDLPYGDISAQVCVSSHYHVDIFAPGNASPLSDPFSAVVSALNDPIHGYSLEQFRAVRTAAIAVNDKTRPAAHHVLLPALLARLEHMGVPRNGIDLIVATGTHAPASAEEIYRTYPQEIVRDYRIQTHNCDDQNHLEHLGVTSRGTPVLVNRTFYAAELRIVTGNIEPHHFMGFSGGVKSAAIGLTARDTIHKNHAMLLDSRSKAGNYHENPMRMDVEEIGEMIGVHFALNTIQNDDLEIIHALAGHPKDVMEVGVPLSRQACQVEVRGLYDLVIASAGGYPKDINLYQSQKALTHAAMIAKDGGWVILVAECREGSGSRLCEQFLDGVDSPEGVGDKFQQEGFSIGPHKAYQIARDATRLNLFLVSDLPDDLARKFFFRPARSISQALEVILPCLPASARIAILPSATHTIPYHPGENP